MLEEKRANYICALAIRKNQVGCAFCDISTGEFYLYQISGARDLPGRRAGAHIAQRADRERRRSPARNAIPSARAAPLRRMRRRFSMPPHPNVWRRISAADIKQLGFEEQKLAVCAAGALLAYLTDTQKNALTHILRATPYESEKYMALDKVALRNLELTEASRTKARRGSLLWILDRTETAMGSRMLRSWIERPLQQKDEIEARLDAVAQLMAEPMASAELGETLSGVYDVERLLSRIAYEAVNGRDALALKQFASGRAHAEEMRRGL